MGVAGVQSRSVHCTLGKRSLVADSHCADQARPADSQSCTNSQCSGVWVVAEWSQVRYQLQ